MVSPAGVPVVFVKFVPKNSTGIHWPEAFFCSIAISPPFHPSPYESCNLAVTLHSNEGEQNLVFTATGVLHSAVSPIAQISRTFHSYCVPRASPTILTDDPVPYR